MFLQGSLFGVCEPDVDTRFLETRRVDLDEHSWIDYTPGWLNGADTVFNELLDKLELRQRTGIAMYDSVVSTPTSTRQAAPRRYSTMSARPSPSATTGRSTRLASTCTATAPILLRGTATGTANTSPTRLLRS